MMDHLSLTEEFEREWKRVAPNVGVKPDSYWPPTFTNGARREAYESFTDCVHYAADSDADSVRRLARLKLLGDCLHQPFVRAIERGNSDFIELMARRSGQLRRNRRKYAALLPDNLKARKEDLLNHSRVISACYTFDIGISYANSLQHEISGLYNTNYSIMATKSALAGSIIAAGGLGASAVLAFATGSILGLLFGIPAGALSIGLGKKIIPEAINSLDYIPRLRKLSKAEPRVKRFHALGPLKNEALGQFERELESAGAFKLI